MRADVEPILVRVEIEGAPAQRASVTFDASWGGITKTTQTNSDGVAEGYWNAGGQHGPTPLVITVEATKDTWHVKRTINVTVPPKPNVLSLAAPLGEDASWYAGKQVPGAVTVLVNGVGQTDCPNAAVAFKALSDGLAVPDTARGVWDGRGCQVQAHWRLGSSVGDQYLRASVGSDPGQQVTVHATARSLPWLAAGLAWTHVSRFITVTSKAQSLQITTKSGAAETTFTVPKTSRTIDTVKSQSVFTPTLGVNTPVFTRFSRLRVSVSADARDLKQNWFLGVSLTQLLNGLSTDDVNVDVQAILHFSRRDVLENGGDCATDVAKCVTNTKTLIPVGAGLIVQLNASNFLSPLLSLFPK